MVLSLWRNYSVLPFVSALCGIVSTVWFPIGVLHEDGLMSFGFSLYAGWVGSALCFFGSSMMICCSRGDSPTQNPENRYYYSKHSGVTNSGPPINSHAKSAHVWDTMDKTSLPQDLDTHMQAHTHQWNMWRICFPLPWFDCKHVIWREQRIRWKLVLADVWTLKALFEQTLKWIQRETVLSSIGMFFTDGCESIY